MIYFGFDLGDGESCITWSKDLSLHEPMPIAVNGEMSFPSAVGTLNGEIVVGKLATGSANIEDLRVCFKRHFLENRKDIDETIVAFVRGVLDVLRQNKELAALIDDPEKACFVVGCPAGWTPADRDRYRKLMLEAGMKKVVIASESRAAFENSLRCNKDEVESKLIQDSVLVIDIGSSTLDLAYVCDGQEHNVEVVGDVKLGGGLMDEMIVQYGMSQIPSGAAEIRELLEANPGLFSRVMFRAREMKEQYFTNEDYYFDNNEILSDVVKVFGAGKAFRVPLVLSPEIVENYVISEPHPLLDKQSFESKLKNMLKTVHNTVKQREPRVVILTGGPSRMRFFQELCRKEFGVQSKIIISREPEFDISRGLCYAGSVDEKAALMLEEIKTYVNSSSVEAKVKENMPALVELLSQKLAEAMIFQCALPALRDWKSSDVLNTLEDLKSSIAAKTDEFFVSGEGKELIDDACMPWTKDLMNSVQEELDAIARKYKMNLDKLQSGTIDVEGSGGSGTGPADEIGKLITGLVGIISSVIIAVICGGAETALIASGPIGIVIGAIIAATTFMLGKDFVEGLVMELPFPKLARKVITEGTITNQRNITKAAASVRDSLTGDPEGDSELVNNLTAQVSEMIDSNLSRLVANSESQIVS